MCRQAPWLAVALLGLSVGCGPEVVREAVYESEGVKVQLRYTLDAGEKVPLGYGHPVTIADVRVAHILASLGYEGEKAGPKPVIRTEHLYDLAEGIAKALGRAGPDDIVVAWSLSHDRRLALFSDLRMTAMQVWAKNDQLYLAFYEIEKDLDREATRAMIEPPVSLPTDDPRFRLQVDRAQVRVGPRTLAIDWRDPYYRKPLAFRARRGKLSRRTIIMQADELDDQIEAEIEDQREPSGLTTPPSVTDAQMRALDQLDGARRAGLVTEAEFQRRRRLILQGRLAEAGYPPETE
jgi:hypothetical protein